MRSCLFILTLLFCHFGFAEHIRAVRGQVGGAPATVYTNPDFDSPVVEELAPGTKIPISTKQFSGGGGMGLFHKIKTPSGKLGYVADNEVVLPKGTKLDSPKGAKGLSKEMPIRRSKKSVEVEQPEDKQRKSIYLTRYVGGTFALVDYTEKFPGAKLHAETPFIGLRMTGPGALFNGPPIDFNLQISPMAPSYLKKLSGHNGNGFLLMTDLMLNLPLYDKPHYLLYYGLGILLNFSDYKVQVGNGTYNSQDLRLGVDFDFGYAYRFSHFVVRADIKAYVEKTFYLSELLTFQTEY